MGHVKTQPEIDYSGKSGVNKDMEKGSRWEWDIVQRPKEKQEMGEGTRAQWGHGKVDQTDWAAE